MSRFTPDGGSGGGGGTATVRVGPKYGAPDLTTTPAVGLGTLRAQFTGLTSAPAVGLGTLRARFTGLTSTPSVAKGLFTSNYRYGATTSVSSGNTGTGWVNPANATGTTDGVKATVTGSATQANGGTLTLTYGSQAGNGFTITNVSLKFYTAQTGTVLGNGSLVHKWGISGIGTTLATFTADVTNNPATYDVTATVAGSWTNVSNIQTGVVATYGLANLSAASCDAVEVIVVATF